MKRYVFLMTLVLAACTRPRAHLPAVQDISSQAIRDYLVAKEGATSCGGKVFSAYQIMGTQQDQESLKIYVWAYIQEYCLAQDSLAAGTAFSLPVVLFAEQRGGAYQIVDYRDAGGGYQLLNKNFPPNIQRSIFLQTDQYNQRAASLANETKQEAEAYYGIHP